MDEDGETELDGEIDELIDDDGDTELDGEICGQGAEGLAGLDDESRDPAGR